MLNKLKPKSEFSRNVVTLMTGTTIAQAIPIAISPILTRLYTPEDFGVFALFIAITSIFGSIANGRYELAIMLPKKDEDAINILALGFIINVALSFTLLLVVLIFHDTLLSMLNNKDISPWLYFVPFSVFLMGCFNLLNYFNNRKKLYKDLAKANVYKSIGMAIAQLSFVFIKAGAFGLVSGQLISQIVSNTKLFFNIKRLNLFSKIKKLNILALGKRYIDFPKFSMTGALASTMAQHFTSILISALYSTNTLGLYSLVQRVLGMPSSLIGRSMNQVFYQSASKEKDKYKNITNSFDRTVKKLLVIGIPFFIILFFTVEDIFIFIFGEGWKVAGTYARITIPLFFIQFITTAVSSTYDIFLALKIELYWKFILFIGISVIIILSKYYNLKFELYLYIFVLFSTLMYIISFYITFKLSRGKK